MANYERDMFTDLRISYSGHLNIDKHNSQLYCYTYTFFTCYESNIYCYFSSKLYCRTSYNINACHSQQHYYTTKCYL